MTSDPADSDVADGMRPGFDTATSPPTLAEAAPRCLTPTRAPLLELRFRRRPRPRAEMGAYVGISQMHVSRTIAARSRNCRTPRRGRASQRRVTTVVPRACWSSSIDCRIERETLHLRHADVLGDVGLLAGCRGSWQLPGSAPLRRSSTRSNSPSAESIVDLREARLLDPDSEPHRGDIVAVVA